jgi:fructose-bisphosphate aldolase, class II
VPLVPTGELIAAARAARVGVLAFNLVDLQQGEGIVAGAEQAGRPVILQVSENAVRFHGGRLRPLAAAAVELARGAGIDAALHLDHVTDPALWQQAAAAGFGSVMVDAAVLPHQQNVAVTAEAARLLQGQGLFVEAELGEIGGKDGAHAPWVRTDPDRAAEFVAATCVDALAVAVGSSHAMTTPTARLDLELIGRLRAAVPIPLVLHGSSGVPDAELRAAVRAGIVKVNIGTALNVAWTAAVRQVLAAEPDAVDPRRYLGPARVAAAATVARLLDVVGGPSS